MLFTIKELCEKSKLSRSTILYYHSIGLLVPIERSGANYRLYSEESLNKLHKICIFKDAGVPLTEIAKILNKDGSIEREILEKTLGMLNYEARKIKAKQENVIKLLEGGTNIMESIKGLNRDLIVESLSAIGVNDEGMDKLHAVLEKKSPEAHRAFLELLGLTTEEIEYIRKNAKRDKK